MKSFKEIFESSAFHEAVFVPSVSLAFGSHSLHLKFDSKDVLTDFGYSGPKNPWLSSLGELSVGKTLNKLILLNSKHWDENFKQDQSYWEVKGESLDQIFFKAMEVFLAALNQYRGRSDLYMEASPLICRCFGVREDDVLKHLKTEKEPTLETLAASTQAGQGCRSCVPQFKRWLLIHHPGTRERIYKNRPIADWLLEIDYMLTCFPDSHEWNMKVEGLRNRQVIISYERKVSQKEEESMGIELQRFLGAGVDDGLAFFLRSSRA
jgi:bacterioferritin-associated ferredoxin